MRSCAITLRDEFDQRANQCSSNDTTNQRQTPIATNVILGTTSHTINSINRRGSFSSKMGPAQSGGVATTRNLSLFLMHGVADNVLCTVALPLMRLLFFYLL